MVISDDYVEYDQFYWLPPEKENTGNENELFI